MRSEKSSKNEIREKYKSPRAEVVPGFREAQTLRAERLLLLAEAAHSLHTEWDAKRVLIGSSGDKLASDYPLVSASHNRLRLPSAGNLEYCVLLNQPDNQSIGRYTA
jgi:hypothetical protein